MNSIQKGLIFILLLLMNFMSLCQMATRNDSVSVKEPDEPDDNTDNDAVIIIIYYSLSLIIIVISAIFIFNKF